MATLLIVLLVISLYGNWLWFVFYTSYRNEILRQLHKKGYNNYAYTNDWWITNRDTQSNARVAGPFSSEKDAGKCREILERKTNTNINMWIERIPNSGEPVELDHVRPISKAFNKIRGGNGKSNS